MKKNSEPQIPAKVIKNRRVNLLTRRVYISLLLRVLFIALVGYLLLSQVFIIAQASGNGMFPALKDGDLLIGFRMQDVYLQNDVILCKVNGERVTGRIVARGGDVVGLDESGQLYVNGSPQGGEIMYPSYAKDGIEYPYKLPEKTFFIMGDYRTRAIDSRDFGPVPLEDVEGKLISILRRRGI